jgi:predicted permease
MQALLEVVTPVFLVLAAGYVLTRTGYFKLIHVDGLMAFTQGFAIPCLLFRAAMKLDFAAAFDWRLLLSFYAGCTATFLLGTLGARLIFGRRPGESVAIGFGALFSNSVILGLPIVQRAYGGQAVDATLAIIAIHAPYCYLLGITAMEIARADGEGTLATLRKIVAAMARNALLIGLALGFAVNMTGIPMPASLMAALDMLVAAALPAALFGLGGVLTRYAFRDSLGEAAMTSVLALIVHPAIALMLSHLVFDLPLPVVRACVLTAAMAPGVNTYVFAAMYKRAEGAAASTILLATAMSVLSVSGWLWLLERLS